MAFASANRTSIRRVEEAVFGTTPATPAFIDTRYTAESLNYQITNIVSNEIRSDRMKSDSVRTEADVSGAIDFELSYASFEDFFIHALGVSGSFSTDYGLSGTTFAAVQGASAGFTDSANGFVAAGILVGDWIRVTGFAAANNNGRFRVKTVAAGVLEVEDGSGLTTEAAGATVDIHGSKIINGVAERSFAIEKEFGDAYADTSNPTPVFLYFNGVRTCGFVLNVNVGEILTGAFNFQGTAAAEQTVSTTDSISVSSGDYVRAAGSWITDGFAVGMQVIGLGFTADANNCVGTISAVTATNMTVTGVTLVDEGAASRTIRSLNPPRFTGATTTAANTNQVMNAVDNVVQVNSAGKVSTSCFDTLTVTYDNNCRPIDCVGTLGHVDVKFGSIDLTASVGLFFENMLDYQRFLNGESFSFAFHVQDSPAAGQVAGNEYTFNFPFAKFETGQLVSEGLDTDIKFQAEMRCLIDRAYPTGTGLNDGAGQFGMFSITKYAAL